MHGSFSMKLDFRVGDHVVMRYVLDDKSQILVSDMRQGTLLSSTVVGRFGAHDVGLVIAIDELFFVTQIIAPECYGWVPTILLKKYKKIKTLEMLGII